MSVMNKEELSKLILENQKEMYVLACSILKIRQMLRMQ